MGVGIAPTKTLAKSAQWATKQWPQFSGVVALTAENCNRILKLLGLQPVGEVWGVGRRLTEKLNALGINTALQLAQANTAFIRKNFSVILERTVRELNGESCISLEEAPPAKQQIVCSRSFGERITDKDAMHQAVVNRPGFPGECFICELRLPDHRFRWKHNKLFLLLPEEYGPAFPAIVDCYTSPPT